ncbi:MAG: hypothetical protein FWD14_01920 [Treponema sp.]|nr:hypothetical protein [Treponema sp.]
MINFKEQQDIIVNYINENYESYLKQYNINQPKITTDYIDFDKYKNDFICYVEFDNTTFPATDRFNDDCSIVEKLLINIFLVFRNDTPANLNEKMLNAASAFFEMIREKRIVLTVNINKIDFFKYIEGTNNIVSSKLNLELSLEI